MSLSMDKMIEVHKEICPKIMRSIYRSWKRKSQLLIGMMKKETGADK